jgi:hypothetical protein
MKTTFPWKQTLVLFVAVLLAYLVVFRAIEWLRQRKGAWEVHFVTDGQGRPALDIQQNHLKISGRIAFPDEHSKTNVSETIRFDRPHKPVPFGKVIYEDLTFLPGVVTFNLFGHEVELLPRVLYVNKKEIRWTEARVELWSTNKPPVPPKPVKGYE